MCYILLLVYNYTRHVYTNYVALLHRRLWLTLGYYYHSYIIIQQVTILLILSVHNNRATSSGNSELPKLHYKDKHNIWLMHKAI